MRGGTLSAGCICDVLILLALEAVGALETLTNLKLQSRIYEVRGPDSDAMYPSVLHAMDEEKRRLDPVDRESLPGMDAAVVYGHGDQERAPPADCAADEGVRDRAVLTFRSWEEE